MRFVCSGDYAPGAAMIRRPTSSATYNSTSEEIYPAQVSRSEHVRRLLTSLHARWWRAMNDQRH